MARRLTQFLAPHRPPRRLRVRLTRGWHPAGTRAWCQRTTRDVSHTPLTRCVPPEAALEVSLTVRKMFLQGRSLRFHRSAHFSSKIAAKVRADKQCMLSRHAHTAIYQPSAVARVASSYSIFLSRQGLYGYLAWHGERYRHIRRFPRRRPYRGFWSRRSHVPMLRFPR